jgi:hypothetical protein
VVSTGAGGVGEAVSGAGGDLELFAFGLRRMVLPVGGEGVGKRLRR